ncbi:hypothetical protein [Enterococcus termitis]|uniref:Uncharacterized protein n=1 Tax=Enterococcus termitis TaxID=332950 RepID=A0A1E5H052_9ENTE|nr:hypothetical protein [Enterococcus termitis]OEG18364.1 hypothetical protein BCR25_16170 [Enterococcus termitis]OJG94998.1 hypothetical protein RV18_GL003164 [Enterococcus termitis]
MDEIALAGGGSVKVLGKGTVDDYMKMAKSNFSKGSGLADDVAKKASGAESSLKYKHATFEGSSKVGGVQKGISGKVYLLSNIDSTMVY